MLSNLFVLLRAYKNHLSYIIIYIIFHIQSVLIGVYWVIGLFNFIFTKLILFLTNINNNKLSTKTLNEFGMV